MEEVMQAIQSLSSDLWGVWFVIGAALVVWMQAGFAILYWYSYVLSDWCKYAFGRRFDWFYRKTWI